MSRFGRGKAFLVPKLAHVVQFLSRQGIAIAGNLMYGLLCVRLLPVPDYAKFAVLFGFMGSLTTLQDAGITGTIVPLVGEQINNRQLIADYLASLRRIALRIYLVVTPIAAIVFVLLVQRQHWGASVVGQMIVVLSVAAWFARVSSSYGAVLILRRDRVSYYRAQIIGSLGSLALLVIFWMLHRMNVYVGVLLNVAQIMFIAGSYYRRAHKMLEVKGEASAQREKEIIRLALPNIPSSIFYSIQGQITLMLITVFGHSASGVASVGALGRLSQILVFLSQMNVILVGPFFAKLQPARVVRLYLLAMVLVVSGAAGFSGLAFLFPEVFLWVLGPKYSQLRFEVGLMVASSSIQYVAGFLWVIHSSRRFVYLWNTVANIGLTLLVQVAFLWKFDLGSVRNVLTLNIATSIAGLVVCIAGGVYGFWRGPQRTEASAGL